MTYASYEANRLGRAAGQRPVPSLKPLLSQAARYIRQVLDAYLGRRAVARLAQLDDRMLSDIGLSRADVDWALLQHWAIDPSSALAERHERRKQAACWARGLRSE